MSINPVAQYQPTNFTTQTAAAYKSQIDANSLAAQRIVGKFAPSAQASPNMTIMLAPGSMFDGVTLTEVAAQSTSAIVAPVSHPRIDRVVIDDITGLLSVVTGSEAVSPVPPAIPNGKSPVAQIALQTSTVAITNAIITDERNFSAQSVGGFGAQTTIGSAATCDLGTVLSRNAKITGMTAITSFGASANTQSPIYIIEFAAALTLTAGAGMLLPTGASITTAAGDTAMAEYLGSGNWRVRSYHRADGSPTLGISGLLDEIINVEGSVLYRGPTSWIALPPGTDGQYIQQVSGQPQWASVPAGGMVAIQTQDINNTAALAFTGIDGSYDEYVFELIEVVCGSGAALTIHTSSNGGTSYDNGVNNYYETFLYASSASSTAGVYSNSTSYGNVYSGNLSPMSGSLKLAAPSDTTKNKIFDAKISAGTPGGTLVSSSGAIWRASTAVINAVQFTAASGNMISGRITLYGIKHA